MPASQRRVLADALRQYPTPDARARHAAQTAHSSAEYQAGVASLLQAWTAAPGLGISSGTTGAAIGMALECAACAASQSAVGVEPVWTGPATDVVPTRQTLGVLFGLIDEAASSVTLMTYAAYRIADFVPRLNRAAERGVDLRLILESSTDSAGRLTLDAARAFSDLTATATIYGWPVANREHGAVMHAKTAVIDRRTAFVTSANLTESAVSRNIELGVVVRGGTLALRLAAHIDKMIDDGILRIARRSP